MTIRQVFYFRPLLWLLLAVPAALIAIGYARGDLFYGKIIHITGDTSVRLLIITLAASPAMLLFPRAAWAVWLIRHRREFGVASFAYALLHTLVYVGRKADFSLIVSEGQRPGLLTGWVSLALMLILAVTSNDISVRLLRAAWKRLHWLVYPAAALTLAHWLLEAFDLVPALVHGGVIVVLVAARFVLARRRRSSRMAS
jgi:sulfoxide reductase heme-binding subunit YedZ